MLENLSKQSLTAAGDDLADQLRREVFALGGIVHFIGDDALAGRFELGELGGIG